MKEKTVKQYGYECKLCGSKIFSNHQHDMRYCECKACFVDGGFAYFRGGYRSQSEVKEVTRRVPESVAKKGGL